MTRIEYMRLTVGQRRDIKEHCCALGIALEYVTLSKADIVLRTFFNPRKVHGGTPKQYNYGECNGSPDDV